jgi:predicted DsbA family dithiol-disulfide isomerase
VTTSDQGVRALQVEIWSDVVCPWCYIGKRRFEQALAQFGHADRVRVTHRAFELDPSAPKDQVEPTLQRLSQKYGMPPDQARTMMGRVEQVAAEDGLSYDHVDSLSGNTVDAHRLLLWAGSEQVADDGAQQRLLEGLYRGYFSEHRSLFDHDALLAVVAGAGLDPDAARAVLTSDAFAAEVADDEQTARRLGATAVPFLVVDRSVGVVGAQPVEVLLGLLEQAWDAVPDRSAS